MNNQNPITINAWQSPRSETSPTQGLSDAVWSKVLNSPGAGTARIFASRNWHLEGNGRSRSNVETASAPILTLQMMKAAIFCRRYMWAKSALSSTLSKLFPPSHVIEMCTGWCYPSSSLYQGSLTRLANSPIKALWAWSARWIFHFVRRRQVVQYANFIRVSNCPRA